MTDDFVIARNPEADTSLPYILRIPLGEDGILLKARETWPRTAKVYCHRFDGWPSDADIVERVPVRSCVRRGAAIDLVLDRGRENRSQFVITQARGRQMIFWQTSRTARQARPRVTLPSARAAGLPELEIVVDTHERYAWKFSAQQVRTTPGALAAGDYGVLLDGQLVASVERKSVDDLVTSLTTGKLKYQLTELASLPRAAVVVEERYSRVFDHRIVRGAVIADALAECQVAFPNVPIVFGDNRKLAQEWAYRFLAAARVAAEEDGIAADTVDSFGRGSPLPPREPTSREVRSWALAQGISVSDRGRVAADVVRAYRDANGI
jgi:hypothetical protein